MKEAGDESKNKTPVAKLPENRNQATAADKSGNWRVRFADEEDWRATMARLKDWPAPTSRKELSNFLGTIAMFRDKISDYTAHIQPLLNLLRVGAVWRWDERESGSFDEIRHMIVLWLKRQQKLKLENGPKGGDDDLSDDDTVKPIKVTVDARGPRGIHIETPDEPIPLPAEKSYRLVSCGVDPNIAKVIADRCGDMQVPLSQRELMAVSRAVAHEIKKNTTKSRQPYVKPKMIDGVLAQSHELFPGMDDEDLQLDYDAVNLANVDMYGTFITAPANDEGVPEGALIVRDPLVEYLNSVPEDEEPKQVYQLSQELYVGNSSAPIRVIFPTVVGKERIESIMDSGSQIVSMAMATAVRLGIKWDVNMQIFMQSANGQLKQSVGLARNILFQFGDVRAHLQVHIFENPAYEILLGRPFEVLTKSATMNDGNGGCTLTITDPNTQARSTLVTHARGTYKIPTVEEVPDEDLPKPRPTLQKENERPNAQGF